MITRSNVIDWLWKHSHYPTREEKGKFWIGMIGPFCTKSGAVKAVIRLERKAAGKDKP